MSGGSWLFSYWTDIGLSVCNAGSQEAFADRCFCHLHGSFRVKCSLTPNSIFHSAKRAADRQLGSEPGFRFRFASGSRPEREGLGKGVIIGAIKGDSWSLHHGSRWGHYGLGMGAL